MSEYITNQYQRDDMNPGAVLYMAHIHGETDTRRSQFNDLHTQFSEIMYNINYNNNRDCCYNAVIETLKLCLECGMSFTKIWNINHENQKLICIL